MTSPGSPDRGPQPPNPPAEPTRAPSLQAPWRLEYLEGLEASEGAPRPGVPGTGSFLRDYWLDPAGDAPNHVLVRTAEGLILLNRYPYANGHLLVALGEARGRLLEYTPVQRASLWALTELATELMERTLEPQGINLGINQGRAAGAGVPQHLHVHLVPRWGGDVNYMAVIGHVRVIPSALDVMARRYRDEWARMGREGRGAPPPG